MKTIIYGCGGFAKEVYWLIKNINSLIQTNSEVVFCVDDEYFTGQYNTIRRSALDPYRDEVIVAIGDPAVRKKIVESLPKETKYPFLVHPSVIGSDIIPGEGSLICAGCILTVDVTIGRHCQINIHSTIGHDTVIGDFVTISPGVNISGGVNIGNGVFIGTNTSIRQGVTICNGSVIGMGAVVVKDITEPGIYVGNPAKNINEKT